MASCTWLLFLFAQIIFGKMMFFFQSAECLSTLKILSNMPKILAKMKEKSVHFSTDPRICLKIRLKQVPIRPIIMPGNREFSFSFFESDSLINSKPTPRRRREIQEIPIALLCHFDKNFQPFDDYVIFTSKSVACTYK